MPGAIFKAQKLAFFLNDEIKLSTNFTLNIGVRADKWSFPTTPYTDNFTNDSALVQFTKYYDLKGARSGPSLISPLRFLPVIGFTYKITGRRALPFDEV